MPRRQIQIPRLVTLLLPLAIMCTMFAPGALAQQPSPPAKEVRHYDGPPWLGFVADRAATKTLKVGAVLKKSPASDAGILPGDVVIEVDEVEVRSVRDLKIVLRDHVVGDTLTVTIKRGKETIETELTLAATPTQEQLAKDQLMGEQAPEFTVPSVVKGAPDASPHALKDLRGKITVVEFWATWCKPCEPFKKELATVHERLGDEVHILAISSEDRETLRIYLATHPLPYAIGSDSAEQVHDVYFVRALPLVLILDETHRVRKVITGGDDPALISKSIQSLMSSTKKD